MKIVFNETQTTVILNNGRLELHPRGARTQRDRRQIDDAVAELPDVKRFKDLGKISILTLEEAARRDRDSKQAVADAAASDAAKAVVKAEKAAAQVPALPKVEEPPAPVDPPAPVAESVSEPAGEPAAEADEDEGKRKSRRRHH